MIKLRELPAPEPDTDLLPRILRSRAMGRRIPVPVRQAPIYWHWMAAAAVVTVLLGGSWFAASSLFRVWESPRAQDSFGELLRTMPWRVGDAPGTPQTVSKPKYQLILADMLDPNRLTPGVWTYRSETTTDGVLTRPSGGWRVRLGRATLDHQSNAWTLSSADLDRTGWSQNLDTTYIDAATLRPLRSAVSGGRRKVRLVQSFSADSGHQLIEFSGAVKTSWHGTIGFAFPGNALFVNDWTTDRLAPLFPAFPLGRGWRGTLYQVTFFSKSGTGSATPLDLRVMGTDRVTVPAGTFECWMLNVERNVWRTERFRIWISRDKGWLIKRQSYGPDYVVNEMLESYEPTN